ncbi:MAG: outer membrane lipoprotein-sorting protein, partial [Thermodesulfobacteriota bacterium]
PTWQRYYDEDGTLIRELVFSDYRLMGGRRVPARLAMTPADKPGEQTLITYHDLAFDVPISDDTFSLRNLER